MNEMRLDRMARWMGRGVSRREMVAAALGALGGMMVPRRAGAVSPACPDGLTYCRGVCADLANDPVFCGSCENTCSTGACRDMQCVACEEIGLTTCPGGSSDYCVDLATDWANCGECANGTYDHFCTSQVCVDGACISTVECEPGLTECNGRCVDFMNDVSHCGGCFGECYGGESEPGVCIEGQCVLCGTMGKSFCGGTEAGTYDPYCADFANDPDNCGGCGVSCGGAACVDGLCASVAKSPTEPAALDDAATQAANAAYALSVLEAEGNYDAVYDMIHPYSAKFVPREAVVGWYRKVFRPLGPMPIDSISVTFYADWQYALGPRRDRFLAAEVACRQEFANAEAAWDVVRLVQAAPGDWRWFFGRSEEFIAGQIKKYAPDYALERGELAGTLMDGAWGSTAHPFELAFQKPWEVGGHVVAADLEVVRLKTADDAFGTWVAVLTTDLVEMCQEPRDPDACLAGENAAMKLLDVRLFADREIMEIGPDFTYGSSGAVFPRVVSTRGRNGETWTEAMTTAATGEGFYACRIDRFATPEPGALPPVDAFTHWEVLEMRAE